MLKRIKQWRESSPKSKGAIIVALLPGGLPLVGGYVLFGWVAGYLKERDHPLLKIVLPVIGIRKKTTDQS